jgi:hypothetical protein
MPAKRIIFRSYDPIAIDLAESRLRAAEIPFVRIGRGNAAMLGAGDSIIEQLLEVDAEHADQARELLTAAASDTDDPDASPVEEREPIVASAKARFIGGGLSLLWPGLGVAYAGFPLTGLAAAIWSLASLVTPFQDPLTHAVFGGLLPRILDFCVAQYWLRRFGRRGPSFVLQAMLGASIVIAFVLGARLSAPYFQRILARAAAGAEAE